MGTREALPSHRALIEDMTRIVEEAAIYAMENGIDDESRIEYIKTRAADAANMAAQVSEHIAGAMINLVREGTFSKLPLREWTEHSGSRIRLPAQAITDGTLTAYTTHASKIRT